MALYPEGDKLDAFSSRYVLANLAARRAKQIKDGAPVLIHTTSTHPITIALEEIAEGAVRAIMVEGDLVPQAAETLDSIDLLAREAGGFDSGFGDIGALLGVTPRTAEDEAPFAGAGMREAGDFEEETISLEDLLDEENEDEDDEDEITVASLADLETDDVEEVEEDEALVD
ncbi:MAG: DNA-directed RNA polymerase subunit omega [Armatimonadetes bacterium]|nr:DNA-directed RNA polymerase subunit omega [Armatimonadota bacterium]